MFFDFIQNLITIFQSQVKKFVKIIIQSKKATEVKSIYYCCNQYNNLYYFEIERKGQKY